MSLRVIEVVPYHPKWPAIRIWRAEDGGYVKAIETRALAAFTALDRNQTLR
jgi:hypothetical protein